MYVPSIQVLYYLPKPPKLPPSLLKNLPKFLRLSFKLGALSPSPSLSPSTGLNVLLAALLPPVAPAPMLPRCGEPKRSTPCLAASISAVPKFDGSKRAGSEGVECAVAVSLSAARPETGPAG